MSSMKTDLRLHAGLLAGVAQVEHGLFVLRMFLDAAEMNRLPAQRRHASINRS